MTNPAPDRSGNVAPHRASSLALLASIAAIALDKRAHGFEVSLEPVRELAAELKQVIHDSEPHETQGIRASFHDPFTVDLLGRALNSPKQPELRSVPELVARATQVTQQLATSDEEGAPPYESLRDFCLALSRAAQLRLAVTQNVPTHPYRR
jgi:hypothetical protein